MPPKLLVEILVVVALLVSDLAPVVEVHAQLLQMVWGGLPRRVQRVSSVPAAPRMWPIHIPSSAQKSA